MSEQTWYYCLKHHTVEPYEACKAIDRLGPYETYADAANALELVARRNRKWDRDSGYDDDGDDFEPDPEPSYPSDQQTWDKL